MFDSIKPLKKVLAIIIFLVLIGVLLFLVSKEYHKESNTESGTIAWLQALCDKDYSTCDSLIASDGYYFTGFNEAKNPISSKIYFQFLDYAVDSIKSVRVLSIKENVDTGYTDYEIEVVRRPYKRIYDLDVDTEKLSSLREWYVSGELSDDDFTAAIQDYYFELFKTCFILSNEEYITLNLVLSEKEDVNGAVFVYNTKTFIEGLISEMYENLEVYQNNIKAKVDTVLRQY